MSIIFLTLLISHLFIAKLNGEEETTENPLADNYLLNYSELTTNSPLEGEEAETRPSRPKRVLSGPIKIPEELHCYDFNDKCRWRNMDGLLVDELDWYQGAGFLDENRLRLTTGTHLLPDGFYGIAASDKVELPGTKAILVSDVIECQNGQANLRFQHWTSPEVRITVCVKSVLRLFPYFDYCSKPVENGNGPVFLTLPELNAPMQVTHNFVFNSAVLHGGFAIIDNLEYFGEFCDRENNKVCLIAPTFLQTVNETNAEISDKQSDKQPTIPFSQHGLRSINILQRKMPKVSEKELFPNTWKDPGNLNSRKAQFDMGIFERRNKDLLGRIKHL
uniref:MAM domain-containing protein n=1 Tax=Meloidogyne javanica TaxID=6303 RepID=A0A915M5W0_MELJA